MLQTEGFRNGDAQIPFSVAVLEGTRPRVKQANHNFPAAEGALRPYEVHLSGRQVLLGSTAALGSVAMFMWVLIKLWLFGR